MKHNLKNVSRVEGKTMKKLVKKIALPGAILAFAMALFGGSAYAYSSLTSWDDTGGNHLQATKDHITTLKERIDKLLKKKDDLQSEKLASEKQAREDKEKLEDALKVLETQKTELSDQLAALQTASLSESTEKQNTIDALQKQIKELNADISVQNIKIQGYTAQYEELKKWRKGQIDKLEEKVEQLEAQVKQSNDTLKKKESEVNELIKARDHAQALLKHAEDAVEATKAADEE